MLKNKFGMLRILLIALSAIMVVSLAACNDDSDDDSNIQDALNSAIASQNALLSEQEASRKAEESSRLESERLAEESRKESERQADESRKAYEESSRLQAQEDSESLSALLSSLAQTTTPEPTKPTETTTTPVATDTEAIKAVVGEYSKLKAKYTVTNIAMYVGNNVDEIYMLFDKAGIDLNNAKTAEAAQDILNQLIVDVEAVESAATVAADVNALIAALGDVETEVITTSATKLNDAKDAWYDMVETYGAYLHEDGDAYDADDAITVEDYYEKYVKACEDKAEEDLGVAVSELNKAINKMAVLEAYIEGALSADITKLYAAFELDFDEDGDDLVKTVDGMTAKAFIKNAYYKYQILTVINGGDTTGADTDVEWEYLYDEEGNVVKNEDKVKQYDYDKPIVTVTAEQFVDVFAVPYLNVELDAIKENDAKTGVLDQLKAAINETAFNALNGTNIKVDLGDFTFADVDGDWDDIVDAFEDELDAITFANTYKTTVTLDDAKADIYNKAVAVYVDILAAFINAAKEPAKDLVDATTEDYIDELNTAIDTAKDKISETENASQIERLNAQIAKNETNIAKAQADLEAFNANVDAAAMYTVDELVSDEMAELYKKADYVDISDFDEYTASEIVTFLKAVVSDVINNNFASEIKTTAPTADGELGALIALLKEDLENLKDRLDPNYEAKEAPANSIFYEKKADGTYAYTGDPVVYLDNWYANSQKFADMVAIVDAAIAELDALTAENYTDEVKNIHFPAKKDEYVYNPATEKYLTYGDDPATEDTTKVIYETEDATKFNEVKDWAGKDLYYINEAAMNYALVEKEWDEIELLKNYKSVLTTTATEYPVTYTYTAAEQAAVAAQAIYDAAYDDVFAALMAFKSPVSSLQKVINNKDDTSVGKYVTALSGKATGDLKSEIDAYVKVYTDKIGKLDDKHDDWFTVDVHAKTSFWLGANIDSAVEDSHVNIADVDTDSLTTAGSFTLTGVINDIKGAAGDKDKDDTIIKEFVDRFFVDGVIADDSLNNTNVYKLWTYKTAAVEKLEKELEKYYRDPVYGTGDDANKIIDYVDGSVAATLQYTYADAVDSKVTAYEEKLDNLLETYTSKIMGVKLNSNSNIATYLDGEDYIFEEDDKTAGIERAKAMVDSYMVDLFGYEKAANIEGTDYNDGATKVYGDSTWTVDAVTYTNADSRIFQAWYAIFDTSMTKVSLK